MIPLVLGVAGGSCSGKTSLTRALVGALGNTRVGVIQYDSYYRGVEDGGVAPPVEANFDHPDALETELLVNNLGELRLGRTVEEPVYDFAVHRRCSKSRRLEPKEILIVEGILVLADKELRAQLDLKIFVDSEPEERLVRRIRRDTQERGRTEESIVDQYNRSVKPMHFAFVEPSKCWADILIPAGVHTDSAVGMILPAIELALSRRG